MDKWTERLDVVELYLDFDHCGQCHLLPNEKGLENLSVEMRKKKKNFGHSESSLHVVRSHRLLCIPSRYFTHFLYAIINLTRSLQKTTNSQHSFLMLTLVALLLLAVTESVKGQQHFLSKNIKGS